MSALPQSRAGTAPVRVLLVDDSAVVRGLLRRWLEGERDIEIAGMACDGEAGVVEAQRLQPDVIILDIEMPKLDGLSALPRLRKVSPGSKIIMASTLSRRGAEVTIKALSLGATDYLPKPEAGQLGAAAAYRRELTDKIRALGGASSQFSSAPQPRAATPPRPAAPAVTRPQTYKQPKLIVVASSTGGPQALQQVIPPLAAGTNLPILIVQHMPATFTTILAEHLDQNVRQMCAEAEDGEPIMQDRIYIAPGGFHLKVATAGAGRTPVCRVDQTPPVNFCRPAADPLFQTASETFSGAVLGVVLTGMGHDGRDGSEHIVKAGGRIIAQDKTSSVVWGMPGAVANAGLADQVLPLADIAPAVLKAFQGVTR